MKIIRLSLANIRKHKTESFFCVFLLFFCMLLLGSSIGGLRNVSAIYEEVSSGLNSVKNIMYVEEKNFDPIFLDLLEEDERITNIRQSEGLYNLQTRYLDENGEEQALYLCLITDENDRKLENPRIETTLSDAQIAAMEHPAYLPFMAKDSMGMREGDEFVMIYGGNRYPFEIAGFYETSFFSDTMMGFKLIVTDADYRKLTRVLSRYRLVGFDLTDAGAAASSASGAGGNHVNGYHVVGGQAQTVINDFYEKAQERSDINVRIAVSFLTYEDMALITGAYMKILLGMLSVMSIVILAAIFVMIRHRIRSDIEDQIVSIGVLEALGYKSAEIALSYVAEYLIFALIGIAAGVLGSTFVAPMLFHMGEIMAGHRGTMHSIAFSNLIIAASLILIVTLVAYLRARMVNKYPPVQAFRKGIREHSFRKNHLPLEKCRGNVHVRLSLKGFLDNARKNIGVAVCILIATVAIVVSFMLYHYIGRDFHYICDLAGMELSDVRIELRRPDDLERIREELSKEPEVRKILSTSAFVNYVTYNDDALYTLIYPDFTDTENIHASSGRLCVHDNEVMLSELGAGMLGLSVGDTMTLKTDKIEKDYIITGLVNAMTNAGQNIYLTDEAYKRIDPTYRPIDLDIYLTDTADKKAFSERVSSLYGRSVADIQRDRTVYDTPEERIRAEAERNMAALIGMYGADNLDYTIRIGDEVISGNSDMFMISSISSLKDIIETQLGNIVAAVGIGSRSFMLIALVVIAVILLMLMAGEVRKQRKELGILKAMGYTTKELMLQMAFRIIPPATVAILLGTALSVLGLSAIRSVIGELPLNIPLLLALDLLIAVFCFGISLIGALRIRKISVYELMTE